MKELVIISGKGGTGKTSVVASFAALAENKALADCDVDAADLHLVLDPKTRYRENFSGGKVARIMPGHCIACGKCEEICRFNAVFYDGPGNGLYPKTFRIDPVACEGCGVCVHFCAEDAIAFENAVNGQWFISDTRWGPMAHARLGIAEENSGKLVTLVREKAREIAEQENKDLIIIDGSPGIGCPVIASLTGADAALIVTEPTLSGKHDLERVSQVCSFFGIKTFVCVNKFDLNPDITSEIENWCRDENITFAGRIQYDDAVTRAQIEKKSVVEYTSGGVAEDIRKIWRCVFDDL